MSAHREQCLDFRSSQPIVLRINQIGKPIPIIQNDFAHHCSLDERPLERRCSSGDRQRAFSQRSAIIIKRSLINQRNLFHNQMRDLREYSTELLIAASPTLDHIVPYSRGGHHVPDNTRIICLSCNVHKSDLDLEVWLKRRQERVFE
jgi:5-methylcytosine-specific restriction endonuclease McrA